MNDIFDSRSLLPKKLTPSIQIPLIEQLERTYTRLSVVIDSRPEEIISINGFVNNLRTKLQGMIENSSDQVKSIKKKGGQAIKEKKRVKERLKCFEMKHCRAWKEITSRFGGSLNQSELLGIAELLASSAQIKVDREAKRRKEVIVKWFDENLDAILPYLDRIELEDEQGMPINASNDNEREYESDDDIQEEVEPETLNQNKINNKIRIMELPNSRNHYNEKLDLGGIHNNVL